MSNHIYTAGNMVQLPRLSAGDAMALGEQVISAARPHRKALQRPVTRALAALTARHADLKEVLRDQGLPGDEPRLTAAPEDRVVDACWGALDGFLGAHARLPATYPQAAEAAEIRAVILPDGLEFLTYHHRREWTESELRLERMRKAGLDTRIEALGGGVFLAALRDAHAAYGKALGMTSPLALPVPSTPRVRDALDAFTAALRDYVVRVMASVEPDEPRTQVLADRLLLPLSTWTPIAPGRGHAKPAPSVEPASSEEVSPASEAPASMPPA